MKIRFLLLLLLFALSQQVWSQSFTEISNRDGVSVSYKISKTDSSSTKKDKYLLEVNIRNNNDYDLAYLIPKFTDMTYPLIDLVVNNTLNILGMKLPSEIFSLTGYQTSLQTADQKIICILPSKQVIKSEYKLITKKEITPIVSTANFKQRLIQMENLY